MNRNVVRRLLFLMLLLSLPALACNLVTGDGLEGEEEAVESTDDVPTVAALAATPESEGEVQEESGGDEPAFPGIGSLNDPLEQFNSYRSQVDMRFENSNDSSQSGTMTMNMARVVDPRASSVEIAMSGGFAEDVEGLIDGASFSFIEVEDTSYSVIPGLGCISGGAGPEIVGEFDDVLDSDEVMGELEGAEFVGEETVNGLLTDHFRFDESNLSEGSDELQEVSGDVYISQEFGHVVRLVFDGVGAPDVLDGGGEGTIHFEYNVLEVDQPITIEPPTECTEGSADYPVMEGANELATIAGLTTYSVNAPLEDVVTFYHEEMAALGYEIGDEQFIGEGTAILTYQAEGMPDVTVNLTADGDTVSVLLTGE